VLTEPKTTRYPARATPLLVVTFPLTVTVPVSTALADISVRDWPSDEQLARNNTTASAKTPEFTKMPRRRLLIIRLPLSRFARLHASQTRGGF
jgi:hypothetical protein